MHLDLLIQVFEYKFFLVYLQHNCLIYLSLLFFCHISGFIDSALRGLTKQASQLIDSQYTDELTDRLFKYKQLYFETLI